MKTRPTLHVRRHGRFASVPDPILRQMADAPAGPVGNVYFELTEAFNARAPTVALASGQAVVYYRVAIISKDDTLFASEKALPALHVIDRTSLIALKRTQRAKDYAVIAELAAALPPDGDRSHDGSRSRPRTGTECRTAIVSPRRVGRARRGRQPASGRRRSRGRNRRAPAGRPPPRRGLRTRREPVPGCVPSRTGFHAPPLEAHAQMLDLASRLLPEHVDLEATTDADAE